MINDLYLVSDFSEEDVSGAPRKRGILSERARETPLLHHYSSQYVLIKHILINNNVQQCPAYLPGSPPPQWECDERAW